MEIKMVPGNWIDTQPFVILIDLHGQTEAFLETNHNVSGHNSIAITVCNQRLLNNYMLTQKIESN